MMVAEDGVRRAIARDAVNIQQLVNVNAEKGLMLALSLSEIYERIRDFYVYEEGDQVTGVCAIHIIWDDLAEIRSLAVRDDRTRHGIGRRLVMACFEEARRLGTNRLFALTYQPEFFIKLGFRRVDKADLPHKVWNDCLKCVKFPNCDEEAVSIDMKRAENAWEEE